MWLRIEQCGIFLHWPLSFMPPSLAFSTTSLTCRHFEDEGVPRVYSLSGSVAPYCALRVHSLHLPPVDPKLPAALAAQISTEWSAAPSAAVFFVLHHRNPSSSTAAAAAARGTCQETPSRRSLFIWLQIPPGYIVKTTWKAFHVSKKNENEVIRANMKLVGHSMIQLLLLSFPSVNSMSSFSSPADSAVGKRWESLFFAINLSLWFICLPSSCKDLLWYLRMLSG